jgi:hypothetical protein
VAEIANEIDLLSRQYLASLNKEVREEFTRTVKSGWHPSALKAALSSFHTRWLVAREVIRG